MMDAFKLMVVLGVVGYAIYKFFIENNTSTYKPSNTNTYKPAPQQAQDDNVVKGYNIHVTPDFRTRLKVLKMRDRNFKTRDEAEKLTFEMHEAIIMAESKSWKELGFDYEEPEPDDVWTDIGNMKGDRLESYYHYLEKFRGIVEDESIKPPEKVKLIRKIPDTNGFLRKLKKKYGSHFPKNFFNSELTNIDGISKAIAVQLFDRGIYDKEGLKSLRDKELLKIKGVGSARLEKIKLQIA